MYISITGLQFKRFLSPFIFLLHAVRSMTQARHSQGNRTTMAFRHHGTYYTLSSWENKESMKAFAYSGAHKKAIQIFNRFFTGKTYGYEGATLPSKDEAIQLLEENGRDYGRKQ